MRLPKKWRSATFSAVSIINKYFEIRKKPDWPCGRQLVKGRIICQHAHRVFVNLQTVCHRFDGDGAAFIGDNPVKLGRWQRIAVRSTDQIHAGNKISGLSQSPTLAQQPGNEFVLSNVSASVFYIAVYGVSHKV